MRPAFIVRLACVLCFGALLLSSAASRAKGRGAASRAIRVATAPEPEGLPFLGPEGTAPDGYPLKAVDRSGLRTLLLHKKFPALTLAVEAFQSAFEEDPRREYWPLDACDAFESTEQEYAPLLDAWVQASPDSFAPLLARGCYRKEVAWARRGGLYAHETPEAAFEAARTSANLAAQDLQRALELRPRLVAAIRALLQVAKLGETAETPAALIARATAACPACLQVRITYLSSLVPRWGGSYEKMREFIATADPALNPRFRLLPGYISTDRADGLERMGKPAEALAAVNEACALGDHWEFLHDRAGIQDRMSKPQLALADLEKAAALRPADTAIETMRAGVLAELGRWEESGRVLLGVLRVNPTDAAAARLYPDAMEALVYFGMQEQQAGHGAAAARMFDLAGQLAPDDPDIKQMRSAMVPRKSRK